MPKRLSPDDYRSLAQARGFAWLGPEAPNTATNTRWKCARGHDWPATYGDIRNGNGCPYCSNHVPKTPYDYIKLAEQRNIFWLGPFVSTTRVKTTWQCEIGHKWQASYNTIQHGYTCPHCVPTRSRIALSHSDADYRQLAQNRGFIWLGPSTLNSKQSTQWQCRDGHVWKASYNHIQKGAGCPFCAGLVRKTPKDYYELAQTKGLVWIGPVVTNVVTKTQWVCPNGHIWYTKYIVVAGKSQCPHCHNRVNGAPVSRPQIVIHQMIGGELNFRVRRYCLDIALHVQGVPICIEYDCYYWHNLEKGLGRDAKRDKFLISQGWHILRIKSGSLIPLLPQIQQAIDLLVSGATYTEIILDDWKPHSASRP